MKLWDISNNSPSELGCYFYTISIMLQWTNAPIAWPERCWNGPKKCPASATHQNKESLQTPQSHFSQSWCFYAETCDPKYPSLCHIETKQKIDNTNPRRSQAVTLVRLVTPRLKSVAGYFEWYVCRCR